MVDYHLKDESRQGPQRLKEPCGRPRVWPGRPRELRKQTLKFKLTFFTIIVILMLLLCKTQVFTVFFACN